jgi:hypothetical protein
MKKRSPPFVYFLILAAGFIAAGWGSFYVENNEQRKPASVKPSQEPVQATHQATDQDRYQKRGAEIIVEAIE